MHERVAGLDVHKALIVGTIAITRPYEDTTFTTREFSTSPEDIMELQKWIEENKVEVVTMETTGKYAFRIYYALQEVCQKVNMCHPKYLRTIKGQKTDEKDSIWISKLTRDGYASSHSFIPDKFLLDLRFFIRERNKIVKTRASISNRLRNVLTVSNIALDNIVTKITGIGCTSIIKKMIADFRKPFDREGYLKIMRDARISIKKREAMLSCIAHHRLSEISVLQLSDLLNQLDYYDNLISQKEKFITQIVRSKYPKAVKIIESTSFISDMTTATIISEIGTDMNIFRNQKAFISWIGLAPNTDQSAGELKNNHIRKAGKYLKPVILQLVHRLIKSSGNEYFRAKFFAYCQRMNKKRAAIALCRKIMTWIYQMLKNDKEFTLKIDTEMQAQITNLKSKEVEAIEGMLENLTNELGEDYGLATRSSRELKKIVDKITTIDKKLYYITEYGEAILLSDIPISKQKILQVM